MVVDHTLDPVRMHEATVLPCQLATLTGTAGPDTPPARLFNPCIQPGYRHTVLNDCGLQYQVDLLLEQLGQ